jgi:peptidoglycan-associated lipoprotein
MKRFFSLAAVLALALMLGACSSAVRLDNVPVVDRSTGGAATTPGQDSSPEAGGSAVAKGVVQTVNLPGSSGQDANAAALARVIYFDYDSYVIRSEFQPIVDAQSKLLLSDKTRKIVIEGHTDVRGGREYNLALGQKRAESVRRALTLLGVSDSQMEAISYGKEKPADLGTSEEAMQKNRRAEISTR